MRSTPASSALGSALQSARRVGLSGSRRPGPAARAAARAVLAAVPAGALVVTGCAPGIDAVARAATPPARCRIFRVAPAQARLVGRAAFAVRSVQAVRCVHAAGGAGTWVAVPQGACPPGLVPSARPGACFSGHGSGTWGALALALGLGLAALVWAPAVPAGWGLAPLAGAPGWWQARGAGQATLF